MVWPRTATKICLLLKIDARIDVASGRKTGTGNRTAARKKVAWVTTSASANRRIAAKAMTTLGLMTLMMKAPRKIRTMAQTLELVG